MASEELPMPPDASPVDPDAEIEFEPFPLADLPSAYWVGRASSTMALGGTACHMLFEFEARSYDIPRLERALGYVIRRHKMLRCIVTEDGMNQVLRSVPEYKIEVTDCTHMTEEQLQAYRDELWLSMHHRVFDSTTWPLFEVRVLAGANRQWMLTDFDHMTVDLRSMFLVFEEWQTIYAGRGHTLPNVPRFTYRMAVERMLQQRETPRYAADKKYWFDRIDALPTAPTLPVARSLESVQSPTFRRLEQYVCVAIPAAM